MQANQYTTSPSTTPRQLRDRRIALGLNDSEFAAMVGVSPEQLRVIENDVQDADVTFLMNMIVSVLELNSPSAHAPMMLIEPPRWAPEQLAV